MQEYRGVGQARNENTSVPDEWLREAKAVLDSFVVPLRGLSALGFTFGIVRVLDAAEFFGNLFPRQPAVEVEDGCIEVVTSARAIIFFSQSPKLF